jgi:hypothetical protein
MAALAHSLDDEPIDPAEAEMSEADFRIIERAHELCGRAAVRELPAELDEQRNSQNCELPALTRIALKILRSQIRAGELVREMKLSDLGDDETDEVEFLVTEGSREPSSRCDWQQVAQAAWHDEGWARAAKEYQFARMHR